MCSDVKVRTESVIEISGARDLARCSLELAALERQGFELYTVTHTHCPHTLFTHTPHSDRWLINTDATKKN